MSELPDPDEFDAGSAAQAVDGGRLLQAFVRRDQDPSAQNQLAVASDFLGTPVLMPVSSAAALLPVSAPDAVDVASAGADDAAPATPVLGAFAAQSVATGERVSVPASALVTFEAEGERVLGVTLRQDEAVALHRARGGEGEPVLVEMLGADVLAAAFADSSFASTGIDLVVVDPLGTGIAFRRDDPLLDYPLRNGALRRAVHLGRAAVLEYLMRPDATAIFAFRPQEGQAPSPLVLRRKGDGASVLPVFSSSLEAFRFNEDVATGELDGPWLRRAVGAGLYLVVDPVGGDAIEFSPAELAEAGFTLPA